MTYELNFEQLSQKLWKCTVTFYDDEHREMLHGETRVAVRTQEEAQAYMEQVFIPDLIRNFEELLELQQGQPEEPQDGE